MFLLYAILSAINIGVGTGNFPIGFGVLLGFVTLYHLKYKE